MFWSDPTLSLETPGGTIDFNDSSGDAYENDPTQCAGLGQAPLRVTIDDAPQTDGGIGHPVFRATRRITIGGTMIIRSSGTDSGIVSARTTMIDNLVAALESIENADGTLSWDSGGKSLTVRCEIPFDPTGAMEKAYLFGLYALNPTIT